MCCSHCGADIVPSRQADLHLVPVMLMSNCMLQPLWGGLYHKQAGGSPPGPAAYPRSCVTSPWTQACLLPTVWRQPRPAASPQTASPQAAAPVAAGPGGQACLCSPSAASVRCSPRTLCRMPCMPSSGPGTVLTLIWFVNEHGFFLLLSSCLL